MKANELKRGMVFMADGKNILVKHVHVQSPSSRSGNTLYKLRGQDVVTRQKFERSFKGDEVVEPVNIERRAVSFLYRDSEGCTFMDSESYEQYTLSESALEEELPYLTEDMQGLSAMLVEGVLLAIELPGTVVLEVTECAPGMKAASSSARTKPATLSTGLVVQVPEYLTPGEKIKVNTETAEFISRA
ncbi:MAG: elongation factor P-like protein YeiP [Gammaproteobacteria bacterium]|nr:MAG: elongation factor P-like protein YeiP [Gammaproteobacteria bacterium]